MCERSSMTTAFPTAWKRPAAGGGTGICWGRTTRRLVSRANDPLVTLIFDDYWRVASVCTLRAYHHAQAHIASFENVTGSTYQPGSGLRADVVACTFGRRGQWRLRGSGQTGCAE